MSSKTILLVGGGSGGHLTPIVAVSDAIKSLETSIIVGHVGQKGENLHEVTANTAIDMSFQISSGKFRRYHGETILSHMIDFKTICLNARDFFKFLFGIYEAWKLLGRVKPSGILLKGGFVCVPVGYAARLKKIPYITHDSDAIPGLANRLTAKHAVYNTTALPSKLYSYEQEKSIQVGIPIRKEFKKVSPDQLGAYKELIGCHSSDYVVLSVGGGLGAQRVNIALGKAMHQVLKHDKRVVLFHITGKKLYQETKKMYDETLTKSELSRITLIDFTNDLYKYSAAADLVITRAGATNIAEFAAQAKTCIVIPNPVLTGGQQLHNAKILEDTGAAIVLQETSLHKIGQTIIETIDLPRENSRKIAENLHKLAIYDSANKLATILIKISKDR